MSGLKPDSLILGYADELIVEYKAKQSPGFAFDTLEDRLARTLEMIVGYIREETDGDDG